MPTGSKGYSACTYLTDWASLLRHSCHGQRESSGLNQCPCSASGTQGTTRASLGAAEGLARRPPHRWRRGRRANECLLCYGIWATAPSFLFTASWHGRASRSHGQSHPPTRAWSGECKQVPRESIQRTPRGAWGDSKQSCSIRRGPPTTPEWDDRYVAQSLQGEVTALALWDVE